ncbi:hypothetical protein SAMN04488243_10483 [Thermus arciformis]|uniref:PH domain-containing protein n=1 Tax=Thermus arciformis TaxID=482827 RepID=A0A1G7E496_9DEIN|nr:hypothetical protein [Thermus arciformis]SDE58340.1 hypothetical protein SAMN04488243_10483 [Thermus arciformis]
MPLEEVRFARLSPLAFWLGVGFLGVGLLAGELPWAALALLYPWWRLRQGFRLLLFPDHLRLHPPLGLGRRLLWEEVKEVEVAFWSAGPLSRGKPSLLLTLRHGERLPLAVPDPDGLAERVRALLAGRTSGSGSRGG